MNIKPLKFKLMQGSLVTLISATQDDCQGLLLHLLNLHALLLDQARMEDDGNTIFKSGPDTI